MTEFKLTEQHLKLAQRMYVGYNEHCEFGAPEINPKRPYGNSDVYSDIAEILDIKPALIKDGRDIYSDEQEDEMLKLHKETETALQVILGSGTFKVGTYKADDYSRNWRLIK